MSRLSLRRRTVRIFAWLVMVGLLMPVAAATATTVGAAPQITVYASNASLITVHNVAAGSLLTIDAAIDADGAIAVGSDVYIGFMLPDGRVASWVGDPQAPTFVVGTAAVPFLKNVVLTSEVAYRVVSQHFAAEAPLGWYMLYGLVVLAGRDPGDPRTWFSGSFFPLLVTPPGGP